MDFVTSFSNPHRVFLSEEKRDEIGATIGDPVELEFKGEDHNNLVLNTFDISDIDQDEETHAMFFLLHYVLDEIEEIHNGLFSNLPSSNASNRPHICEPLKNHNGLREYLDKITHINDFNFSNQDIAVGCGVSDILVKSGDHNNHTNISSPFSKISKETIARSMKMDLPEIDTISKYSGTLKNPGEMYICTYNIDLEEPQRSLLMEQIVSDRYINPSINYEYHVKALDAHGMVDIDRESEDVLLATEDNIKFSDSQHWFVKFLPIGDIDINSFEKHIEDEFNKELFEYDLEYSDSGDRIILNSNQSASVHFIEISQGFEIRTAHVTRTDINELELSIMEVIHSVADEEDCDVEMFGNPYKLNEVITSNQWVLDTNSIYRQKPGEDYNSISEFLINNEPIYKKEMMVPWNVICEINRHKDSNSSRTQNASEQGLENLKILHLLDRFGIINLNVEEVPESIDNSIRENSGVTDLAIINKVPEDGVLLTSDRHLLDLAQLDGVLAESLENIGGLSEPEHEDPAWDVLEEELLDEGPILYDDGVEILESGQQDRSEEMTEKDPGQIINDKVQSSDLIEVAAGGQLYIALSSNKEVVPTFSLLNDLIDNTESVSGDTYLSENALEQIRRAIGGMSTTHRPNLTFLIPSEYVFKASEISQINTLESLNSLKNSSSTTINWEPDQELSSDIENAVIRTSLEENSLILCSPEADVRKYNLLGLDFKTVEFS